MKTNFRLSLELIMSEDVYLKLKLLRTFTTVISAEKQPTFYILWTAISAQMYRVRGQSVLVPGNRRNKKKPLNLRVNERKENTRENQYNQDALHKTEPKNLAIVCENQAPMAAIFRKSTKTLGN